MCRTGRTVTHKYDLSTPSKRAKGEPRIFCPRCHVEKSDEDSELDLLNQGCRICNSPVWRIGDIPGIDDSMSDFMG